MRIKPEAIEVIKALIQAENVDKSKVTYYSNLADYASRTLEPQEAVLLPNVIFWDPLNKLPISLYCPHCHQDKKVMNPVRAANHWYITTKSHQPRVLWERGWHCALVGKAYICSNKHFVVSYHSGFLTQIPDDRVPFLLTHLTGITKSCYDLVVKLFEHGNSFTEIQHILEGMFLDTFERKRLSYPNDTIPDLENIASYVPSDGITKQYFIVQHDLNKDIYQSQMDKIPFNRLYISTNKNYFDVNIGVKENISSKKVKWLKLFDTMFLVFNEDGCVKAYGLTNGVCIDQVVQCLLALAPFNPDTELISMNSYCCDARDSLVESFPNASITYGVDCAKELLREHLKTNDEKHEVVKELDSVFQTSKMVGVENEILKYLDSFIVKWNKDSEQNSAMLKESFLDEAETLKFHILNGCFSNEPPKTFVKEEKEIFKQLGNIFKSRFLGVQPACAMIAHVVYVYNCRRIGQVRHQPIWIYRPMQMFQIKESENEIIVKESEDSSHITIEVLSQATETTVENETMDTNQEVTGEEVNEQPQQQEIVEPEQTENKVLLSAETQQALFTARLCYKIFSTLKKVPKIHQPYLSVVVNIWDHHSYLKTCFMHRGNKDDLKTILTMLGLKTADPMRTSSFSSLVHSLTLTLKDLAEQDCTPKEFVNYLTTKGMLSDVKVAMECLQQLVSKEMVGEHEALYDRFLVLNKKSTFAKDPINAKLFKSEIDIATIHAVSNIFGVAFVIIPACREAPVLPVLPSYNIQECLPCFITFDPDTAEFGACIRDRNTGPTKKVQFSLCSCGSKGKSKANGKKCKTMRCNCFMAGNKCSDGCTCISCGNDKPPKDLSAEVEVEDPPKKKQKRRSRNYDFLAETATMVESGELPLPIQVPDLSQGPSSVEARTEISSSDMHNCFLDALMFILMTEHPGVSKERQFSDDEELPELLYGAFLAVHEELTNSSLAREGDGFLEFLTGMEFNVAQEWVKKGARLYKLLKALKSVITTRKVVAVKKGERGKPPTEGAGSQETNHEDEEQEVEEADIKRDGKDEKQTDSQTNVEHEIVVDEKHEEQNITSS